MHLYLHNNKKKYLQTIKDFLVQLVVMACFEENEKDDGTYNELLETF